MKERILEILNFKDYTRLKTELNEINCIDLAYLLSDLSEKETVLLFRFLTKENAAQTFAYMESDMRKSLIHSLSDKELQGLISELYLDDTVDLIEDMPANVVTRILRNADSQTRSEINALLHYSENSAGSIMTTEYVTLQSGMTCDMALKHLRRVGIDKETIYTCYVTESRKLIGVVTVKDILISQDNVVISDIMERNVISAKTTDDKENVARMFDKYDFLAIPIVDDEDRIVGIVTVDDAIDVLRDAESEDIEVMAAITPTAGKTYIKTGVLEIFSKRILWLLVLMISSAFTAAIITSFESSLAVLPILTAYIPMLMNTGGNAGGQVSVTIIRGLALDEIKFSDTIKIIFKEIKVGVLCGLVLSIVNFAKIVIFDKMIMQNDSITLFVAFAVSLTLFITVVFAKIVGSVLPIFAKKIRLDPALMASPFITTIVDALALVAYFKVATVLVF